MVTKRLRSRILVSSFYLVLVQFPFTVFVLTSTSVSFGD